MSDDIAVIKDHIMPYSWIVGQERGKLALELAYIAGSRIGGVLLRGDPGTGKSTLARAFALMVSGELPITLPINATADRVVGGVDLERLLQTNTAQATEQPAKTTELPFQKGLLEEANNKLLYVDEVNLLSDYIVDIILDPASTGNLDVQRDGIRQSVRASFILIGTMNPKEGELRPQLRDRFGLEVRMEDRMSSEDRKKLLQNVLKFDEQLWHKKQGRPCPELDTARADDTTRRERLKKAQARFQGIDQAQITVSDEIYQTCIERTEQAQTVGHRGAYVLILAAKARAALRTVAQELSGPIAVTEDDITVVEYMALDHRRRDT